MSISDNRLAEIAAFQPLDWGVTHMELVEMATELQSLRAAAKVRAIREGDGEWQTMESAPLNGRHCILAVKDGPFVYSVQGAYDGKQWNCVHRENVSPLYWMPNKLLPKGWEALASTPAATGGEGE